MAHFLKKGKGNTSFAKSIFCIVFWTPHLKEKTIAVNTHPQSDDQGSVNEDVASHEEINFLE